MNWPFVILALVLYIDKSYQECDRNGHNEEACLYDNNYQDVSKCRVYGYGINCFEETAIPLFENFHYGGEYQIFTIFDSNIPAIKLNSFRNMPNLLKINITDSNVDDVEFGAFYGLSNLKYLALRNNSIGRIPKGLFNNLSNLKALDLSMNKIHSIEDGSFLGVHLQEIYINNNKIEDIQPLTENCLELIIFDISHNKISTLESIENCRKLLVLSASNNQLKELSPHLFHQLPLKIMDISSNMLNNLDINTFNGLDKLYSLDLSGNQINELINFQENGIFQHLYNLHILNLSSNSLTNLSAGLFTNLPSQILDLSSNILENIDIEAFNGLDHLDILDLSGNNINSGQPNIGIFQHLHNLRVLNLSSNSITNLQLGLFSNLNKLEILNISNNALTSISEEMFHDLRSLRRLYINNNMLTRFNGPQSLWEINIDGNPWNCQVLSGIIKLYKNSFIVRGTSHTTSSISGISCRTSDNMIDGINNKINESNKFGYGTVPEEFLEGIQININNISNAMQKFLDINEKNQNIILTIQQNSSNVLKHILSENNNNIINQFKTLFTIFNNTYLGKDKTDKQEITQSEKLGGNNIVAHATENSNIFVGVLVVQIVFLVAFCLTVFYFIRFIKIRLLGRQIDEIHL